MLSTTLVAIACSVVPALAADVPASLPAVFFDIFKRQGGISSEAYNCHANCGYAILDATGDYCTDSTWTNYFDGCMACANTYGLWEDYGSGVQAAADGCDITVSLSASAAPASATATSSAAASSTAEASTTAETSSEATSSAAAETTAAETSAAESTAAETTAAETTAAETTAVVSSTAASSAAVVSSTATSSAAAVTSSAAAVTSSAATYPVSNSTSGSASSSASGHGGSNATSTPTPFTGEATAVHGAIGLVSLVVVAVCALAI